MPSRHHPTSSNVLLRRLCCCILSACLVCNTQVGTAFQLTPSSINNGRNNRLIIGPAPVTNRNYRLLRNTLPPPSSFLVRRSTTNDDSDLQQEQSFPSNPLSYITQSSLYTLSDRTNDLGIGEDAGIFNLDNERWGALGEAQWLTFMAAVGTILTAVYILWINASTGYGDDFTHFLESLSGGNSHLVTLGYGIIFPLVHSGLATLRPYGEQIVGNRMWRVIFAFPSLCLAFSWITYFISHAHDGYTMWDISDIGWVHTAAWIINFISFLFLYPSVFNLKEVAAVEKPQIHLWETGIIRITRHPQFVGQCLWSLGHLAMVGTTFTALTMGLLVGHHYFACWNGDRRLLAEHGEDFMKVKERTSIVPFKAIVEGRQILPKDYYKELLRLPYLVIAVGSVGAYFAHPFMQGGSALVRNVGWVEGGILDVLFS